MDRNTANMDTLSGAMMHLATSPTSTALVLIIEPIQDDSGVDFHIFFPDDVNEADVPRWFRDAYLTYNEDGVSELAFCSCCAALQERLDDLVESHKRTVAEACNPPAGDDRLHCHCVPALRAEVAELTEKLKRAEHIKYKDDRHVVRLNEARNGLINEVADLRQLLAQHGICGGCGCMADGCGPALWAQGKKCCPDCSHG